MLCSGHGRPATSVLLGSSHRSMAISASWTRPPQKGWQTVSTRPITVPITASREPTRYTFSTPRPDLWLSISRTKGISSCIVSMVAVSPAEHKGVVAEQKEFIIGLKKMKWLLLVIAALAVGSSAQSDCSRGACYPPTGDLLLGRAHRLHASSTCGLAGSEIYCTPLQQVRMKCCPCDSRNPSSSLAHTVQDVLSTAGPDRWWQSKKEVNSVSIQLDLPKLFQLEDLILNFKGPRPNALVIEKTLDEGRSWQPVLYFAANCQASFPGVTTAMPRSMDQTYCYTLPPVGPNHYGDQMIHFSPLHQYFFVSAPEAQKIEYLSGLTGLRVRMTDLGKVPRLPGRALSRFYALKEMKVIGSCMCHGHANRCLPDTSSNSIQVGDQCECQHNTAGVNCERCADLYNDLPWRPAEESNTHTCQRCECHNHAQSCRFDQAVYEASGRQSGGVCERCMHHTTGQQCEQCAPGYQPNPRSTMDQPDACTRCVCSAEGAVDGGQCDDVSGSCRCKANVEGSRCDRCKSGFYGLNASNPQGCTECSCSPDGSSSSQCDLLTGQCSCHSHFHGLTCDRCFTGHWKPVWASGCESCGCDPTNSLSDSCDQWTGQCKCRAGFGGRTCTECPDNTYGDPLIGCQSCGCSVEGIIPGGCDKKTGVCVCRLGVTGPRCDMCSRGHCDSFPTCETCPLCYFDLESQIGNLSLSLADLSRRGPSSPAGTGQPTALEPRIKALEAKLKQIRSTVPLPPSSSQQMNKAFSELNRLRDQMEQLDGSISPLIQVPGQGLQLEALQAMLDSLVLQYNAKNSALMNSQNANYTGAFSAIKKAYDESTGAAKRVEASDNTVDRSEATREDTMDLRNQVQPGNIQDLEKLDRHLASRPDLTPTAKQVCGSTRSAPCTPQSCEAHGDLCPVGGVPPCGRGDKCVGALPLGKRAVSDATEVKDRVGSLTNKIEQAEEKLEEAKKKANQVTKSSENLSNQIKQTRDELETDLKDTRNVVKDLRDFLSAPKSNLRQVKEVSDWILNAKLPLNLAALNGKLKELKKLSAGLTDSADILKQAGPQLDTAGRLLQEAKDTRDAALGVKADVKGLLSGFDSVEDSISGLRDKLQDSMETINDLNSNLTRAGNQLTPAEMAIRELSPLTLGMQPQLDELRDLLHSGSRLALNATQEAANAKAEADTAAKDLGSLEKQLGLLQDAEANSSGGAQHAGDRIRKMQQDAGSLAKDTGDLLKSLAGKADSLRRLQGEVLHKSQKLHGLDTKLQDLLAKLRNKANYMSTCRG
ncbi:Laminin subunit beta-3 [Merluccius polli]|uniref:Laminin subunit beta-3 n=1 Tax=Merluccius polli TaxID=89951 RepID=A0AA47NW65_MERPO|nr:Laminin subunit beta-3 [Merluccius polli]